MSRPHCLSPDACRVKTGNHCRKCCATRNLANINADPARVAARQAKSTAARNTDEHREKRRALMAEQRKDPAFRAILSRNGRRQAQWLNTDPNINVKRSIGAKRTLADPVVRSKRTEALVRALAEKLAKRVGIPVELVPLFRRIRDKVKAAPDEAVAAVLASPEAKALTAKQALAERVREAGKQPAPGTPERAVWLSKVHGEARP